MNDKKIETFLLIIHLNKLIKQLTNALVSKLTAIKNKSRIILFHEDLNYFLIIIQVFRHRPTSGN